MLPLLQCFQLGFFSQCDVGCKGRYFVILENNCLVMLPLDKLVRLFGSRG